LGTGSVINNGTLSCFRENDFTIANDISGTGNFIQSGTGKLTLTGTNTYTNTTSIGSGAILQIGDNGTTGSVGTGNIFNSGTFIINRSDDVTIANTISLSGSVNKLNNNTVTFTANTTYSGVTNINAGTLVIQNNAPTTSSSIYQGAGQLRIEPAANSFSSAFSTSGWTFGSTLGSLTIGKASNTSTITLASATSIAGPISVYGGDIAINENLNTTAGGANGDILLKASGDIITAASKSITTAGGDVILWSNSDGQTTNGGIFLKKASSISTSGGHIWIGGGSSSTTWNDLTVGDGFAVSGSPTASGTTNMNYPGTGNEYISGINLYEVSLSSSGGDIYMAGQRNQTSGRGAGITNASGIGTLIDAGNGAVTIKGDNTGAGTLVLGIMTGLRALEYSGAFVVKSSKTTNAIAIDGTTSAGTETAGILIEGTARLLSKATSNGAGISITGSSVASGSAISIGRASYNSNAILDVLSASGTINVNLGSYGLSLPLSNYIFRLGSIASDADVANSSADIVITSNNLNLTGNVPIRTTGTLTVTPTLGNSFTSAFNTSSLNFTSVTGLTIGNETNTANITIGSATTIAGPITANGGTIALNSNLTSTATTGTGISLNGQRIVQNAGIAVTTSGANIDYLASDFSTTSGADNAIKIGALSGARSSINAGSGNISLTGSYGTTSVAGGDDVALWLFDTDVITSGTGSITLTGDATNTLSTATFAFGINMGNATVKTESGAITLNGTGGKAGVNSRGIVANGRLTKIVSVSGAITLNEIKPTGLTGTYTGLYMQPVSTANSFIGADGTEVPTSSSSVTIKGDKASFFVNGDFRNNINTSGAIVLESVANSFEAAPTLTGLTISGNPSSVRIGKTTNTANITLGSALTAAGPIEVHGGTIAVNAALTATDSNINLTASTAATQTAAITANGLALNGAGNFTLQNAANNVGTIAGGDASNRLGNVAYRDADALVIGSVNPTGIFSSGNVLIETENGDITLSQNINTTSTSSDAIIVNAGKDADIGTATGGDIKISGTPTPTITITMGTGGIAKLFSGSETESTGLSTLAGGSTNIRFGVDETTSDF
jgi:autotransporter-associated beta strand protein